MALTEYSPQDDLPVWPARREPPERLPHGWEYREARAVDEWLVGVDLGQSHDPTAICALHHRIVAHPEWSADETRKLWIQKRAEYFDVRHLERLSLNMPYTDQVAHVRNILQRPPLDTAKLVIDETGVGRPVGDIFDAAGLRPWRVTITSGMEVSQHRGKSFHVPKAHLISTVDARLHTGELRFAAELREAGALAGELKDFRRKVSEAGRATWSARVGAHDDLVLAVAIATWFAVSRPRDSVSELLI